jgi:F-type H+-transporting ATPase subunit c
MGASIYLGLLALGVVISAPLAAIGAAIGDGLVFASYLQGIARQPAAESKLRLWMFICFGILETPFIISLVFFFVMKNQLPVGSAQDIINMFAGH